MVAGRVRGLARREVRCGDEKGPSRSDESCSGALWAGCFMGVVASFVLSIGLAVGPGVITSDPPGLNNTCKLY